MKHEPMTLQRKRERELKKEKQGQYYQQEWLSKATHINEEAKCKLVSRLEFICDGGLDSYIPYTLEVIRYEAGLFAYNYCDFSILVSISFMVNVFVEYI